MEANLARADQQARKHAAKLEAKEKARAERQQALDAAGVPKQAATKHVKKIVATADKRRERMRQPQPGADGAEGEAEASEQQLMVRRDDGTTVVYGSVVQDIQGFLQSHGADCSVDEVRRGVGVDLLQPGLMEALRCNPRIETVRLAEGERLRYKPPHGVSNRGSLAHTLSRAAPGWLNVSGAVTDISVNGAPFSGS